MAKKVRRKVSKAGNWVVRDEFGRFVSKKPKAAKRAAKVARSASGAFVTKRIVESKRAVSNPDFKQALEQASRKVADRAKAAEAEGYISKKATKDFLDDYRDGADS